MANFKENLKRYRFAGAVFLAGSALLLNNYQANAQVFTGGSSQAFQVCENATSFDISSMTAVSDPTGSVETYSVVSNPLNGTVTGFPGSISVSGGFATPPAMSFQYVPNLGYSGVDIFVISVDDGSGVDVYDTFYVTVNPLPALTITNVFDTVCAGVASGTIVFTGLSNVGPTNVVFGYTGMPASWTVPAGITSLTFDVVGASGGGDDYSSTVGATPDPGAGGRVQGFMAVAPGEPINVFVGGMGQTALIGNNAPGGWNGGGNAYYYPLLGATGGTGGSGGGASDLRVGGMSLNNRVVVAGGGGGNGYDNPLGALAGGNGGGTSGQASAPNAGGSSAGAGNPTSGGAAAIRLGWVSGTDGSWGQGGDGSTLGGVAGGGGGGWYGGGGGVWNGGGGGSSYTDPASTSLITHTQGFNAGANGSVKLTYNIPGTYVITWNPAAVSAGFVSDTGVLPTSPISYSIPTGAPAGTYGGTLTVSNGSCTSATYSFSVTVNPLPSVNPVSGYAVCNGSATSNTYFAGSGAIYTWTNDNSSFGLPPNGTDSISAITAVNATANPEVANITVTPMALGCSGTPVTFAITANPTPMLSSSLTPDSICSGSSVGYMAASATSGTSFSWSRAAVANILPFAGSGGSAAVSETLTNTSNTPIPVVYTFSLTANGCSNQQTVTLGVEPTPTLSSATTITGANCDSAVVNYIPQSLVFGTNFAWSRNIVTGISNGPATGTGNINETLHNVSSNPVNDFYTITLHANGCTNIQDVNITVNPLPSFTSPTSKPPICSGASFTYIPASTTTGATFGWIRDTVVGISNRSITSTGSVTENLVNTTDSSLTVIYQYQSQAFGCSSPWYDVAVVVKPKPMLSSSLTPNAICDNNNFVYTPSSYTPGTSFTWYRPEVAGISQVGLISVGAVNETLTNTTTGPVTVTYIFTLDYLTCLDTQNVTVVVNPAPKLTSTLNPMPQCDSLVFKYTPTSSTTGATFNWTRAYVPGILEPARSGTGNPNELLINSTNVDVNAVYAYTATYNGCTSSPYDVTETVHPTPKLSSGTREAICTDVPFSYKPTSFTPNATFEWTRPYVPGIGKATNFGVNDVLETLIDSTSNPVVVQYLFQIAANGCTNPNNAHVFLTVNPAPAGTLIAPGYASPVCASTFNETFSAENAPAAGIKYTWTVENGTVWSTADNAQYALVNFLNAGQATVTLTSTNEATGCQGVSSVDVTVTSVVADNPEVIYYQGMFVCLNNQEKAYQWGYDNVNTLQSTVVSGAVNQSYIDPTADFAANYYWVIVESQAGCFQKIYYNPPAANYVHRGASAADNTLKIYPDPVVSTINLEFSNPGSGDVQYEIVNMLGQKLLSGTVPQAAALVDASSLVPGSYVIICYNNGIKIATSRFIKN